LNNSASILSAKKGKKVGQIKAANDKRVAGMGGYRWEECHWPIRQFTLTKIASGMSEEEIPHQRQMKLG
jgi:hypothetical protein